MVMIPSSTIHMSEQEAADKAAVRSADATHHQLCVELLRTTDVMLSMLLAVIPDADVRRQADELLKSDKGLWPDYVIDETRDASGRLIIVPFYSESLDAAVTLVPEGLAWTTGQNVHHWYWQTGVNRLNEDGAPESVSCSGPARTPALALCAAALRAKAAPAPKPPYPFCRTPEKCAGKGYCPAEFACND